MKPKNQDKRKVVTRKQTDEMAEIREDPKPFVFEEDKKLLEEFARRNSYMRGLIGRR